MADRISRYCEAGNRDTCTAVSGESDQMPCYSKCDRIGQSPKQHCYPSDLQVVVKVSMPQGLGTDTPFSQQQASADVWDAGPDQFAQEPIFCPRPDAQTEDDGWVFTMVYDSVSDCSHLAVLDARHLQRGPIARIKLPQRIPYGKNHSCLCKLV